MAKESDLDLDKFIQPARPRRELISVGISSETQAKVESLRKRMKEQGEDLGLTLGTILTKVIEQLILKFPPAPPTYSTNGFKEDA